MPRCVYVALEAVRPAVFGSQVSPKWLLRGESELSCQGESGGQKVGFARLYTGLQEAQGSSTDTLSPIHGLEDTPVLTTAAWEGMFPAFCIVRCNRLTEKCTEQVCRLLCCHRADTCVSTPSRKQSMASPLSALSPGGSLSCLALLTIQMCISKRWGLILSGVFS